VVEDNVLAVRRNDTYEVGDDHKMDFFYVLKGVCSLEFEVRRIIDNREQDFYKMLTEEELEMKRDTERVQELPRRLSSILIDPYFQTEVIPEVANKGKVLTDSEVEEQVRRFFNDPNSERDPFTVSGEIKAGETLSDYSLENLRPDFSKFNQQVFDQIRQ
jgi:hypothetical protein